MRRQWCRIHGGGKLMLERGGESGDLASSLAKCTDTTPFYRRAGGKVEIPHILLQRHIPVVYFDSDDDYE